MNQILRCDWLPERVGWSHLACSGLSAFSRKKNFPQSHILNRLLTKLVRSRRLGIGLVLFLRVYGMRWNTQKKNEARTRPISSHLDRTSLVNKGFIIWLSGNFSCGTRRVVPSGQGSSILPAQVTNHSAGFDSSCLLTELAIY